MHRIFGNLDIVNHLETIVGIYIAAVTSENTSNNARIPYFYAKLLYFALCLLIESLVIETKILKTIETLINFSFAKILRILDIC